MKTKLVFLSILVPAIGLAVLGWVFLRQPPPQRAARVPLERVETPEPPGDPTPPAVATAPIPEPLPPEPVLKRAEIAPSPPPMVKTDTAPKVAPQSTPARKPKEPLRDPLAREAMALVGLDADAEAYWLEAINDPTLPDNEREDLIEDLNESGFSDGSGRRATVEDLPLIEIRLLIVEELWPYAMDENNWKSFAEVYKDLTNMRNRLLQQ